MNRTAKVFEILLVEDNWGDALLTKIAFKESRFSGNLNIVTDGEQALSFLKREDTYREAPLPDLILLDLNLPRMDGRTFLRRMKSEEKFRDLKVVVMTSSKLDSDFREIADMKVEGYLVKPLDLYGFFKVVEDLTDFLVNSKALPVKSVW
ncbi:MAG TPA: response regulator [bacterium]|nr:response regulator [bacterium]